MSCANSPTLRQSGATAILRPGAEARTPFGTPFFRLVIDPNTDTGTFVKRPLNAKMWEEMRAWKKLQRTGKLPENRSYAGVLQGNRFTGNEDSDAPTAQRVVGAGLVVGGPGYPTYFVPDVDGLGDGTSVGESASTAGDDNDDRLWPDTYSDASDSDIDYILDGFVVIDMADATGSVFWKLPRRRRRKVSPLWTWDTSRDTLGTDCLRSPPDRAEARISKLLVAHPQLASSCGRDALGDGLGYASGGMATYHQLSESVVGSGPRYSDLEDWHSLRDIMGLELLSWTVCS